MEEVGSWDTSPTGAAARVHAKLHITTLGYEATLALRCLGMI